MYLYLPIIDIQMKYKNYNADNEDFCLTHELNPQRIWRH